MKLEEELNAKIRYLPPKCTAYLKPLDLSIIYTMKIKLKNQRVTWYINQYEKSRSDFQCPCPSKQDLYQWLVLPWNGRSPINIIKSFLCSGLSNSLGGSEDVMSKFLLQLSNDDPSNLSKQAKKLLQMDVEKHEAEFTEILMSKKI